MVNIGDDFRELRRIGGFYTVSPSGQQFHQCGAGKLTKAHRVRIFF